jgi:hypothetical protein
MVKIVLLHSTPSFPFSFAYSSDITVTVLFIFQGKVKAKDLRGKKKDDLLKQLDELKTVG